MGIELQKDKNLSEIVKKLKNHFKPEKVYLFGSQANGTARENSDYDLFLIVKESKLNARERMREALDLLWECEASVDVFVYTEEEFKESKDEFSSIAHTVATEGQELPLG